MNVKPRKPFVHLGVKISPALSAALEALAQHDRVPKSESVRRALEEKTIRRGFLKDSASA